MPLSEHEQRLLEQMERALYAEDPKFATSLRSSGERRGSRRRASLGVMVLLAGTAGLLAGVATSIIAIGVAAFVVMLVGATLLIGTFGAAPAATEATATAAPKGPATQASGGFMDRVEERWRKRRDGDTDN